MILEPTMISICCIALTVFHPGPAFRGEWQSANASVANGIKGVRTSKSETSMASCEEASASLPLDSMGHWEQAPGGARNGGQ
jgi:hypothetical protein